ncbi:hypothetical protein AVEN_173657-1 [Araneus ventricosus]|uniref:Uncharacterized protein n=1 Tax=Araneus ventricosus TaxID=182803 RepID=A0A4Y2WW89_ARAVE|nr:hypothetical protein AVEN_173657-1 [Araneus ventricosus]
MDMSVNLLQSLTNERYLKTETVLEQLHCLVIPVQFLGLAILGLPSTYLSNYKHFTSTRHPITDIGLEQLHCLVTPVQFSCSAVLGYAYSCEESFPEIDTIKYKFRSQIPEANLEPSP